MFKTKINFIKQKILFLGYGAVGKCVWNYFDDYFSYHKKNVVLVDRTLDAFYGPKLNNVKKIVMDVDASNFEELINDIGFKKGDIIIDVTTASMTYYFIKQCLIKGFYYINTSIEDEHDQLLGTSIDCQQHTIMDISKDVIKKYGKPTSTVLTECGQNPGLIQHYVLYALNKLNQYTRMKEGKTKKNDFRPKTMQRVINDYKIGTIFMSEIDNIKRNSRVPLDPKKIHNTWSVAGYVFEAIDKTELVYGKTNNFVQPIIPKKDVCKLTMKLYPSEGEHQVLFLKDNALHTSLNSICPVLNELGEIEFVNYRGKLIHHGEVFELARFFGENAPFMSYVYKNSPYIDQSIKDFFKMNPESTEDDLNLYVNQHDTYQVFDNISKNGQESDQLTGHDSIGCTIFCGDDKIDKIFWCGTILSNTDANVKPEFTPTIVQVAAGVLSGLSFILEHEPMGWIEPTNIDTIYMLEKSVPLLGKFFFTEIPVEQFSGSFIYKNK